MPPPPTIFVLQAVPQNQEIHLTCSEMLILFSLLQNKLCAIISQQYLFFFPKIPFPPLESNGRRCNMKCLLVCQNFQSKINSWTEKICKFVEFVKFVSLLIFWSKKNIFEILNLEKMLIKTKLKYLVYRLTISLFPTI